MKPIRVLLAYNLPVLPVGHPSYASEVDILQTVEVVGQALEGGGYTIAKVGYARQPRPLLDAVAEFQPDCIYNLFEGEADRTETETANAAVLEWLNVPFTGSPSWSIALGRDKVRSKYLFRGAGLPTAAFIVVDSLPVPAWDHGWPAIVKPACQDSSVGIEQNSIVESQPALEERVRDVLERFGAPVLVERYIPGREFHINLYESHTTGDLIVLPFGEVRFEKAAEEGRWPIYTYQAKWNEDSIEYNSALMHTNVRVEPELGPRMVSICKAAFRVSGMRDYGRVDLRVSPEGEPYILEVNPNPYIHGVMIEEALQSQDKPLTGFLCERVLSALRHAGR